MPDDIKISALTNVNTLSDTAVFPMVQDLNGTDTTLKASMSQVAGKVAEGTTFVNLTTTAKDLVGAINEAASTGGSVDITTEIDTPASVMTFNDGGDDIPIKSLVAEIKAIQTGTGTPSPTNVRSISGINTVNLVRTKKNIFDGKSVLEAYFYGTHTITSLADSAMCYALCKPNTTYTISKTAGTRFQVAYTNKFPQTGDTTSEKITDNTASSITITTGSDANYIVAWVYNPNSDTGTRQAMIDSVQIEEGSSATTYETPQVQSVTVALGQSVYGGYLDVISGVLTITSKYVELDGSSDESWEIVENTNKFYLPFLDIAEIYITGDYSNKYDFGGQATSVDSVTTDKTFYTQRYGADPQVNKFWVYDSSYSTVEDFKLALASTPMQIVCPLREDNYITLQLSSNTLNTLSGLNNIFADCGDIKSLEYFNENGNDIDSLVNLENRLSGRIRTKTYTGDGSVPLVVTFDEVPTMILNIFGNGQGSQVICFPFVYGLTSFGGVYVTPNPWTSPTKAGGGHLLYKVAYSNGGKTMTVRASADDAGAQFNQNGDTYTIYYLV